MTRSGVKDWLYDHHGLVVNRKRIQRLRRLLAIETLYPKRNLSLANQQHKVYPYLLRGLEIDRPNQVWARYFEFYNDERRHQSLGKRTPSAVYFNSADKVAA